MAGLLCKWVNRWNFGAILLYFVVVFVISAFMWFSIAKRVQQCDWFHIYHLIKLIAGSADFSELWEKKRNRAAADKLISLWALLLKKIYGPVW